MLRSLVVFLVAAGSAAAQEHTITITGPEELVLPHEEMTCGGRESGSRNDTTDVPVNAFRRQDGSVIVVSGNKNNYYLEGPSVEDASRTSCESIVAPIDDPDPATFTNHRWLFGVYAKSYDFVLGFVHNEYHGNEHVAEGCERSTRRDFECWYGSTGLVVSYDGGATFETPPYPDNVLAAPSAQFEIGRKRFGINTPKVVGNPHDGMVYVMVNKIDREGGRQAQQCVLRGSGLEFNDWRGWDGEGFNLDMESPYAIERGGQDCMPVLPYAVHSLKYAPGIDRFIALGVRGRRLSYSFSRDLVEWTKPETLMEFSRKQDWQPGQPAARSYFSLLDPESTSINFDTLESQPYLYFVQYGTDAEGGFRRQRDIYRMPLKIE